MWSRQPRGRTTRGRRLSGDRGSDSTGACVGTSRGGDDGGAGGMIIVDGFAAGIRPDAVAPAGDSCENLGHSRRFRVPGSTAVGGTMRTKFGRRGIPRLSATSGCP